MYIPEEMKVNKFVQVAIPSNKDFFARLGNRTLPVSAYTGDQDPLPQMRKVDSLADMDAYDRMMQEEESKSKPDA